jgi:predicted thioesterase
MIGKMEVVAAAMVASCLGPEQITVGARNEVSHLAVASERGRVCAGCRLRPQR